MNKYTLFALIVGFWALNISCAGQLTIWYTMGAKKEPDKIVINSANPDFDAVKKAIDGDGGIPAALMTVDGLQPRFLRWAKKVRITNDLELQDFLRNNPAKPTFLAGIEGGWRNR